MLAMHCLNRELNVRVDVLETLVGEIRSVAK